MRLNEEQLNRLRGHSQPQEFAHVEFGVSDVLDTIDALTRERDEALLDLDVTKAELAFAEAAIAAAIREAAELASETVIKWRGGSYWSQFDGADVRGPILALTPATAIYAERLLVAQARIETANEIWLSWVRRDRVEFTRLLSDYIEALTAALEAIQKEKVDDR